MILSICAQFCSHTACSLLVILQGALWKQSFFYAIFNSQNNIGSMRRYPELQHISACFSIVQSLVVPRTISLIHNWKVCNTLGVFFKIHLSHSPLSAFKLMRDPGPTKSM